MTDKTIKIILACLWFVAIGLFFIVKDNGIETGTWRFMLERLHLQHELAMPYFTPARAGGFFLAADAQDMLLTVYMAMALIVPNIVWAIKISNALLTIVLGLGVYAWLPYFGVNHQLSRFFAGILASLSGYWIYHMGHIGHLWGHGLAYLPWIMVLIEQLLVLKPSLERKYLLKVGCLVFLFFLLINSGYYFFQVAVPIILFRLIIEFVMSFKQGRQGIGSLLAIGACGAMAIVLSLQRLGGVYEFQLTKFPRLGDGFSGYIQVVGNTAELLKTLFRSFFDGQLIIQQIHSPTILGFMWDYNNFIGLAALLAVLIGLTKVSAMFRSRAFIALLLACVGHLLVIRSTHFVDLVNMLMPVYRSITWHWRGNAILIFLVIVLVARGYEVLFASKRKTLGLALAAVLMLVNLGEIVLTNMTRMDFSMRPSLAEISQQDPLPPNVPLDKHYRVCLLGGIFGYSKEEPDNMTISWDKEVTDSAIPGFYNMHDVRQLASPTANGGYYMKNSWPLWPKADHGDFEKFIHFKQVVPLPLRLQLFNWICIFTWAVYLSIMAFLVIKQRQ